MSNLLTHAKREFELARSKEPKDQILALEFEKEILAVVDRFGESGQSGGSAPYYAAAIADTIRKLCMFEPLLPIEGSDDEFVEVDPDTFQNKRLSSVFKDTKGGKPYFINAIVWQGPEDWDTFAGMVDGHSSHMYIKSFPFAPKTFYVDVLKTENGDYIIKDPEQLKAVYELYEDMENK